MFCLDFKLHVRVIFDLYTHVLRRIVKTVFWLEKIYTYK